MGDIQDTIERFLEAFRKLQLDEMVDCFNEDATVFFPTAHHRPRSEGRKAIREVFNRVLGKIRTSGATEIRLDPEDVRIKAFGDTAIVTFHIRDSDLCRRTLILRREGDGWGIEHFHASNAPLEAQGEA